MLPTGSRARRFSPSQNISLSIFGHAPGLVIYITDNLSGRWQGSQARPAVGPSECSMSLTPFLKEASFDPEAIKAMSAAFEAVAKPSNWLPGATP
jgi:hypothetical protein